MEKVMQFTFSTSMVIYMEGNSLRLTPVNCEQYQQFWVLVCLVFVNRVIVLWSPHVCVACVFVLGFFLLLLKWCAMPLGVDRCK